MAADLSEQGYDYWEEDDKGTTSSSSSASCRCFRGIICSSWRRSGGYVLYQKEAEIEDEEEGAVKEKWWEKRMKKVKVLWELLGGSKWKNFLRYKLRMIRTNQKKKRIQFQYDPESYALNFDEGCVDFSARLASPVVGNNRQ